MDEGYLIEKLESLSIWKKGEQRAPHKPLLILYAFAKLQNGKKHLPYEEVHKDLSRLLKEFGPVRKSYHPEQPFVRLKNDGIWMLNKNVDLRRNFSKQLKGDVSGGFTTDVFNLLSNNSEIIGKAAQLLLEKHFPETIHEDILLSVGLELDSKIKKSRDPNFRNKILRAYEYSCAICGFNVRLQDKLVGIEAAHIKWHQAGGPDHEENGIALCSMHHKLFDRGVFTLNEQRELLVAQEAHGTNGFNEWLMKFHGQQLRRPIQPEYAPRESFVHWHVREVFRGPARYQVI